MEETKHISNDETEHHKEIIDNATFIGYGVVAPVIFAVGLAGNLATLVTLSNRTKFSGRIYTYLRALAISDLGCLILSIIMVALGTYRYIFMYTKYTKITICRHI